MTIVVHKTYKGKVGSGSGRVGGAENGLVGERFLRKHASPGGGLSRKTNWPATRLRVSESNTMIVSIFYEYYIVLSPILECRILKTIGS